MPSPLSSIGKRIRALSASSQQRPAVPAPPTLAIDAAPLIASSSQSDATVSPQLSRGVSSDVQQAAPAAVEAKAEDVPPGLAPTMPPRERSSIAADYNPAFTTPLKTAAIAPADGPVGTPTARHKRRWSTPQLSVVTRWSRSDLTKPSSARLTVGHNRDDAGSGGGGEQGHQLLKRRSKSEPIFTALMRTHRDSQDIDAILMLGSQPSLLPEDTIKTAVLATARTPRSPFSANINGPGMTIPGPRAKRESFSIVHTDSDADKILNLGSQAELVSALFTPANVAVTPHTPSPASTPTAAAAAAPTTPAAAGTTTATANASPGDGLLKAHRRSSTAAALQAHQSLHAEIQNLPRTPQVYVKHTNDISDLVDTTCNDAEKMLRVEQLMQDRAKRSAHVVTEADIVKPHMDIDEVLGMAAAAANSSASATATPPSVDSPVNGISTPPAYQSPGRPSGAARHAATTVHSKRGSSFALS
ncbi:hypothetical protein RI367_003063 [Sorochytrium milnesiophthora]